MYQQSLMERVFLKIYYLSTTYYFKIIHGIEIGKKCKLSISATIRGNITIGDNVTIGKFTSITGNITIDNFSHIADFTRISTMPNAKIEIGQNCLINEFNIIGSSQKVIIKDYALFGAGVKITDSTHGIDHVSEIIKRAPITSEEVVIGRNCWLGFDVNVIKGGGMGDNCVIGSQSLVNKILPANVIAVGTPVKVIKERG